MADLIGSNFDDLPCSVSLTPFPPGSAIPEDSYRVCVSVAGTTLLDQKFDVHGWQLGHSHFIRLAKMFQTAPSLIGKKTDISVGFGPDSRSPVILQEGVPWFLVRIYGAVSRIGRFQPRIIVYLTIEQEYKHNQAQLAELEQLQALTFYTAPSSAEAFGNELLDECMQVRVQRAVMGLEVDEDALIPLPSDFQQADSANDDDISSTRT